jgi:hypothetical protein
MRHIALILILACGGSAGDGGDPPDPGWCCDGLCGLSAEDARAFDTCTCDGIVRGSHRGQMGECLAGP